MVTSSSMQTTHTSVRYGKQAAAHVNTTPKAQGRIPCQDLETHKGSTRASGDNWGTQCADKSIYRSINMC